jgi:hypothetical protein
VCRGESERYKSTRKEIAPPHVAEETMRRRNVAQDGSLDLSLASLDASADGRPSTGSLSLLQVCRRLVSGPSRWVLLVLVLSLTTTTHVWYTAMHSSRHSHRLSPWTVPRVPRKLHDKQGAPRKTSRWDEFKRPWGPRMRLKTIKEQEASTVEPLEEAPDRSERIQVHHDDSVNAASQHSSGSADSTPRNQTESAIVTIDDIKNINPNPYGYPDRLGESLAEAQQARQPILDVLNKAGLQVDLTVLQHLPHWQDVVDLYGSEPVVLGMETCAAFREAVPINQRFVGVAGQMNVGTNALAQYFLNNLVIPENPRHHGVLVEVPWNKHGWPALRNRLQHSIPSQHELVMPIVLVRDPYFWMHSMCESPYTMLWNHTENHCPNLVAETGSSTEQQEEDGVPVHISWHTDRYFSRRWSSLAHVWSEWYREYYEADFPRLIIRFEGESVCAWMWMIIWCM